MLQTINKWLSFNVQQCFSRQLKAGYKEKRGKNGITLDTSVLLTSETMAKPLEIWIL